MLKTFLLQQTKLAAAEKEASSSDKLKNRKRAQENDDDDEEENEEKSQEEIFVELEVSFRRVVHISLSIYRKDKSKIRSKIQRRRGPWWCSLRLCSDLAHLADTT